MEGYRPGRWSLDSGFGGALLRSLVWRRSIHAEPPIKVASMLEKSREEIAGSAQRVLEQTILGHVQWALQKTGLRNLALAGGVATLL